MRNQIYEKLCGNAGSASGSGLCSDYDGQWECGNWSGSCRRLSLVRFRSVPGSAKEIGAIFLAMCSGLVAGMGYLAYALLSAVLLGGMMLFYNRMDFGTRKRGLRYKTLHITIPEDLDYSGVFDKILKKYTTDYEVVQIKTTNMGSLFKLTYNLTLKDPATEKNLIDALRCRNGNLEITMCRQETIIGEL